MSGLGEALRHRQIRRFLGTVVLSNMATAMAAMALGQAVYDRTGRELDLGLLGLAEFAPALLLVLVTGHVADRFARQHIQAFCLVGEAVALVALVAVVRAQ